MCFRPAGVETPVFCPHCDKKLPIIGNTILKKCPFCKTAFSEDDMENLKAQFAGEAAGAAAAPAAPGAPAATGDP